MLAAQINRFDPELTNLNIVDVPRPVAGPRDVVVKINVAAANAVDWKVMSGYLEGTWNTPLPWTIGYDFSGVVDHVGDEVTRVCAGEEVFGVNWGNNGHGSGAIDEPVGGAFAEYIRIPAGKVSKKPVGITHEQAAAIPLVGTTARQALHALGVNDGKRLVVLGGSGAVGIVAIQLAKLAGADVVATCSPRSFELVASLGADQTIDYTSGDWAPSIGSVKVDAVLDTVGIDGTLAEAKSVLVDGGTFASIVNLEAGFDPTAHTPLSFASFFGLANNTTDQDALAALVDAGELILPVNARFSFTHDGVRAILETQQAGRSVGKNLLTITQP